MCQRWSRLKQSQLFFLGNMCNFLSSAFLLVFLYGILMFCGLANFVYLLENFRLVNAATGTGKTVAYLAPIIHHMQQCDPRVQRSDGTFGMSALLQNDAFSFSFSVLPFCFSLI